MVFWRAFREAVAEVRVDSLVRFVLAVVSPIVSVIVVKLATGSYALAGLVGLGILLLTGVAVFLGKLFTVPIAMANEAAEREALATAKRESEEARKEKIVTLTVLMAEGRAIMGRFQNTTLPDTIQDDHGPWVNKVIFYLNASIDNASAVQFHSASGNAIMTSIVGRNAEMSGYWRDIGGKCQWLDNLISDLRRRES